MADTETFGSRAAALTTATALLELEEAAGKSAMFADVDRLVADVVVPSLRADAVFSASKGRHSDSIEFVNVNTEGLSGFSVKSQQERGAWFIPEKFSLKAGLAKLPWTFATYPRYASGIVSEGRAVAPSVDSPEAVLYWSVLQPLFEQLFAPFELRGGLSGEKEAEDQLAIWQDFDELVVALGFELSAELAVLRYGGGWGELRGPEQLAAKQSLLAAMASQASPEVAARYRAYRLAPLIDRYYAKAKNGQALRKSVLTKALEKTLSGFFGGDWLKFLGYIEEAPHTNEEIATAIPATELYVGTTRSAAAVAADVGVPASEVERALAAYWDSTGNRPSVAISPVDERVSVLSTYWEQFDQIHARQAPGMASLWGLVEESRSAMLADWVSDDNRYIPGCYLDLLSPELLADIERLWSPTMLARWPERIVTEIAPHAALAEAFGAALKFWQGASLTAWFLCEGPYSRTDMAGLAGYHADALEQLDALGCPIDPALFAELIEGESRLGPEEPTKVDTTSVGVSPGVSFEMTLSTAMRRPGFEGLRDIITCHRRAWAERYLASYLKARWDGELRLAARHHAEAIAAKGKPPTAKQFAKHALEATNHWLGGDIRSFYAAIGEKSAVHPVRVSLMPTDRTDFARRVFSALGGQPFHRQIVVASREEGRAQGEEQDRHTKTIWLASQSLHFTQLEEALGRPPELKEFGTPTFAYRCGVLSADVDEAWERYSSVIDTVRQQPAGDVERQPAVRADVGREDEVLNEVLAPPPPPPPVPPPQPPVPPPQPVEQHGDERGSWRRRFRGR